MKNIKLSELSEQTNLIFKNVHIIDPAQNTNIIGDVFLKNGVIQNIGDNLKDANATTIDCTNLVLCPALVETQVQIKNIDKHIIQKISAKAVQAGITNIILLPETSPIIDTPELVSLVNELIEKYAKINIHISAALTKQLQGQTMVEYGLMQKSGAHSLSNGEKAIKDTNLLYNIMNYVAPFHLLIHDIPTEPYLNNEVNESALANYMGLNTTCEEAELIAFNRNILLANKANIKYNATISSAKTVKYIENENTSLTTSIFHLCFNENDIGNYNTQYKISPPLRSEQNRIELLKAIEQGNINIITSMHKEQGDIIQTEAFSDTNPPNFGMQLLLPLALRLYHNKSLSLYRIIETLCKEPARIFNLKAGSLKYSDFIIFDPNEPCIIENHALQGVIKATFSQGKLLYLNR